MKKRHSLEKAEWSNERENFYYKDSLKIAFNRGIELIERDGTIYKIENGVEILFCAPEQSKRVWFQTWLKLREH